MTIGYIAGECHPRGAPIAMCCRRSRFATCSTQVRHAGETSRRVMGPLSRQPLVDEVGPSPRDGRLHLAALPAYAVVIAFDRADGQPGHLVELVAVEPECEQGILAA